MSVLPTTTTVQPNSGGAVAATPPSASAGSDQTVSSLGVVTLDGSGSTGATSYSWSLSEVAFDGTISDQSGLLSDSTAESPTFTPRSRGAVYQAQITATNDDGSDADCSVVSVTPDDTQAFTSVPLTAMTVYDSSTSAYDSGNSDLANRVVALNTGASNAETGRDCVMLLAEIEIPERAYTLTLRMPTITFSPSTANDVVRMSLLDSTDDATADGATWDIENNGFLTVDQAFTTAFPQNPGITPDRYAGSMTIHYNESANEWRARSRTMAAVDSSDEMSFPQSNTGAITFGSSKPQTVYIGWAFHKPGALATTFTFDGDLEYEWGTV